MYYPAPPLSRLLGGSSCSKKLLKQRYTLFYEVFYGHFPLTVSWHALPSREEGAQAVADATQGSACVRSWGPGDGNYPGAALRRPCLKLPRAADVPTPTTLVFRLG